MRAAALLLALALGGCGATIGWEIGGRRGAAELRPAAEILLQQEAIRRQGCLLQGTALARARCYESVRLF